MRLHPVEFAFWLAAALLGLVLSGAYSGLEIGCYRVSEARLRLEAERQGGWWRRLLELTQQRDRLIALVLIGNSLSDYLATGALAVAMTGAGLGPGRIELYTTLLLGPALFVFGEMVPKALLHARAETLTVRGTPLLWVSRYVFTWTGLIPFVHWLTRTVMWLFGHRVDESDLYRPRERIRSILLDTVATGVLSPEQYEFARNVLDIRSVTTRQAMTPLGRSVGISLTADLEQVREAAAACNYSRLLVHAAEDPRQVLGYIDVDEVLLSEDGQDVVARFLRPAVRLDPAQPVTASLLAMKQAMCPIAVVEDRRGRPLGVVTLKDLVEQIVGELTAR